MPKNLTRLTVFVSGTAEIEAEKASLERVLEDLSGVLEKTHGVTLRLEMFPDTLRPGINTDPQAEINAQIADYDIYVGILGSRFGTPTPRAGSGTEEEFEGALERFKRDPRSVRAMFYFKRMGVDPFATDLAQLGMVRKFRDGLSERGVLYRDFKDTPEFIDEIRANLHHLIIDEWEGSSWRDTGTPVAATEPGPSAAPTEQTQSVAVSTKSSEALSHEALPEPGDDDVMDEELGYFELVEEFNRTVEALTPTLDRIGQHTTHIGGQFQARTKETEQLARERKPAERVGGSRSQQEFVARAKRVVDEAGDDLETYAAKMGGDILTFREYARAIVAALRRLEMLWQDEGTSTERQSDDRNEIARFVGALTGTRDNLTAFQSSVAQMPPLTGHFKRARRKATAMLGELLVEIQFLITEGERILSAGTSDTNNVPS